MPYVTPEQITKAKEMDLLTYLQLYEPDNLVRFGSNTYCTREHDSLKISNGKWHWFSRGIGGRTALDYLIKVRNYTFPKAVEMLSKGAATMPLSGGPGGTSRGRSQAAISSIPSRSRHRRHRRNCICLNPPSTF